jgi:hypothetical protein
MRDDLPRSSTGNVLARFMAGLSSPNLRLQTSLQRFVCRDLGKVHMACNAGSKFQGDWERRRKPPADLSADAAP